jgi:DNA-binding transcriptional ArsR family regulator
MSAGPLIASVAAVIGDPARANMLSALMDGRARTARELGEIAGVAPATASGHLSRLVDASLVEVRQQGRHRYFTLSAADVADALETLMSLAQRTGAMPSRSGPRDAALREARICYDHLAGEKGVRLLESLSRRGLVAQSGERVGPTEAGRAHLGALGIDLAALGRARRPLCRLCLDWSERRMHLAGALGAALLDRMLVQGWLRRGEGRVLRFTPPGLRAFEAAFPD